MGIFHEPSSYCGTRYLWKLHETTMYCFLTLPAVTSQFALNNFLRHHVTLHQAGVGHGDTLLLAHSVLEASPVSHRKLARCKGNITWLAGAKLLNQSHCAIHNSYPLSFYMFLYDKVATIRIEPIGTGSDRRLVSLGLRGCICCLEESVSTDWHTWPQKQKVKTLNRKVGSC
jgi:hypothetical protein